MGLFEGKEAWFLLKHSSLAVLLEEVHVYSDGLGSPPVMSALE